MALPDFSRLRVDAMNEADVRETIVRPLIDALGYTNGGDAYVRSERTLRYDRAFLGRQNAKKDPSLVGRADYECGITAFGRWIVEVKTPAEDLTIEDAQQAHTYAAHPEIAAELYLLTNGRSFKLYQTSFPDKPVTEWALEDTAARFDIIENILGPESLRKRATRRAPDVDKPLGKGLPSRMRFVGGAVTYSEYRSPIQSVAAATTTLFQGHRSTITNGGLRRDERGLLTADIQLAAYFADLDLLNRAFGMDRFTFDSADEYVSTNSEAPTVFQNFASAFIPADTQFTLHGQSVVTQFGFRMSAHTQAVGFTERDELRGVFEIRYEMTDIDRPLPNLDQVLRAGAMETSGMFAVRFVDAAIMAE
jgi:hypothetical protein